MQAYSSFLSWAGLDPGVEQCVVIIGGGPSSLTCAETLRKEGYFGRIMIISREKHPPCDRPKLSKALDIEPVTAYLRQDVEYYISTGIELYNNTVCASVSEIHNSQIKLCFSYLTTALQC